MKKDELEKKNAYRKRMHYFEVHPAYKHVLHMMNKVLTYSVFVLYPLLLFWLYLNHGQLLFRAIVVPLDSFIILSVARYLLNRKRPYELYETPAAVHKDTKGKSFPSRHVFSAFMIAVTFLYLGPSPYVGLVLIIIGTILAGLRVALGVHFVSDVVVGAIAGILFAVIGYSFW